GFEVIGVDSSSAMIDEARRAAPGAVFVEADVRDFLQRETRLAALIVASSVLEYLADPLALVRLAEGRLAPGGTLAVSVPDRRSPLHLGPRPYKRHWRNDLSPRDYQRAGLRLVRRFGAPFLPEFLGPLALP